MTDVPATLKPDLPPSPDPTAVTSADASVRPAPSVLPYASGRTPRPKRPPAPPEVQAAIFTVAFVFLGLLFTPIHSDNSGAVWLLVILFGIGWYTVARFRRRIGLPRPLRWVMYVSVAWCFVWTVVTTLSGRGALLLALEVNSFNIRWRAYLVLLGVAVFAAAEVAAWVHLRRVRPAPQSGPPDAPAP